jgi:chromosome partitioning protein
VTKASGASAAPGSTSQRSSAKGGRSKAVPSGSKKKRRDPTPPDKPGVARIIAIANQKGGVGKSTTAVSLGAALADLGYRVLVVDLDPQGNASTGLGIKHEAREVTVYDVIVAEAAVADAVVHSPVPRLHAIPSTIDLAGAEIELVSQFSRETRLKKALSAVREGVYDFIFLDCPPSLGLLTINALTAAEELIVPIQCEYYALEGLGQLLRNVSLVQQNINQDLRLSGIVMTMFDPRTKLSEQVVAEVQRYFGDLVYDVIIPRTVRLSEAPGFGQPITVYDPRSKGAETYRQLGREVALRPPPAEPMPSFEDLPTVVMPAIDDTVTHDPVQAAAPDEELPAQVVAEAPPAIIPDDEIPEPAPPEPADESEPADPAVNEPQEPSIEAAPTVSQTASEQPPLPGGPPDDPAEMENIDDEDELWEDMAEPVTAQERVSAPRSPAPPGHLPERRVVVIDDDTEEVSPDVSRPGSEPREDQPADAAVASIGSRLEDEDDSKKRRWRLFRKGGD